MILFLSIALTLYSLALLWALIGFLKLPPFRRKDVPSQTEFTLIIPFRNEAENLPFLLDSLKALDYPTSLFEILFIDDASEDDSVAIIKEGLKNAPFLFQILPNQRYSNSPKKDAITHAVKQAHYKWIMTTDADCKVPKQWLKLYDQYIQERNPKMLSGPILFDEGNSFLEKFQLWDGLSLQAATMAGFGWHTPILNNGGNLAFKASAFFEVNGYEGNNHLATGDDVFLMEKIQSLYPDGILFIKNPEVTVITKPLTQFQNLLAQRIRWASKTSKLKNWRVQFIGALVCLGNIAFIVSLLCCFIYPLEVPVFVLFLLFKIICDLIILTTTARFFNKKILSLSMLAGHLFYPFLVVWVFMNSWSGQYEWKGRSFKK